ncbi:MAG: hypothetical protein WBG17_04150 [Burkholderiaceae bacterium]
MTWTPAVWRAGLLTAAPALLAACHPEPPSDLPGGQRAALEQSRQLGQQMQQQLDTRMQAEEPAER